MALSPAEKQKAYRNRQRQKTAAIGNVTNAEIVEALTNCGYYAVLEKLSPADRRQFIAFCIAELMVDLFGRKFSLEMAAVFISSEGV